MAEDVTGRTRRSKAEWAAILEGQERSGLSAARYCREQDISYKQFLYRRRVLRKNHGALAMSRSPRGMAVSGGFIPVHVNDSAGVRIQFPMGLVLESDGIPSPSWVVEVARRWADGERFPC